MIQHQQELDKCEDQEMTENRSVVKSKLNERYERLVNHLPNTTKNKVSKSFRSFKSEVSVPDL